MSSPAVEKPSERASGPAGESPPLRIRRASEAPPTARRRALVTGAPPRPGAPPLNIGWRVLVVEGEKKSVELPKPTF